MKLKAEYLGLMQIPSLLWLFENKLAVQKDFVFDRYKYKGAVLQQLLMPQTSVWFNRVIDHSKALCKAIYYIPAAH